MENENIKVFLRIKPTSERSKEIRICGDAVEARKRVFAFDRVFERATQQEVYTHIAKDFIVGCMQGYNCVVFAYGQTGSGKTYTIQGSSTEQGLVPRTLGFLHNAGACIRFTFLEIYNEQLFDLFSPEKPVAMREDPFKGVYVENLTEVVPQSYEESMRFYGSALCVRKTSATMMNNESSRSHSILTIHVRSKSGPLEKQARIIFVDLAGSERLDTLDPTRKAETSTINRSLLCLGEVIKKLGRGEDHVNYRDSKLTFFLREALAGNSRMAVIGTVNPGPDYITETINTLKFVSRVKLIKSSPVLNSDMRGDAEELREKIRALDAENQRLRMQNYLRQRPEAGRLGEKGCSDIAHRALAGKMGDAFRKAKAAFHSLRETALSLNDERFNRSTKVLEEISRKQDIIIQMEKENIDKLEKAGPCTFRVHAASSLY
ncbi:UNVERIFIED_CONTAM: hypothetical protein PYX00_011738 [Menopon gallinae]|uniref:Kinesin-like protein n=1 Tax=Menopon gallinae TaxID=328185 RepID=A0AAW2H8G7_9NEOP